MRSGAHPVLKRDDLQERRFPAQPFEERKFGAMIFSRCGQLFMPPTYESNPYFGSLNARRVPEEITECNGVADCVIRVRVVVHSSNAIS
jgi:hypothetical protein